MEARLDIENFNHLRYELFAKEERTEKEENQIDELAEKILNLLELHLDSLEFEFIMEQLANLGHCPNLLNDDNGHWAVISDGYQNAVFGDEMQDVETHFYVEAKNWKDTPREALKCYFEEFVEN